MDIKLIKMTYIVLCPLYIYSSPACFIYSVSSSVVSIISYLTSHMYRPNKCFDNYRYYKYRMVLHRSHNIISRTPMHKETRARCIYEKKQRVIVFQRNLSAAFLNLIYARWWDACQIASTSSRDVKF